MASRDTGVVSSLRVVDIETTPATSVVGRSRRAVPGLLLALAIGAVAQGLAHFAPTVGAPVIAIVIGIVIALVRPLGTSTAPGVRFASRAILQVAVVLLGAELSFAQVITIGRSSLPVLLGTLVIALAAAWLVGRALGVVGDTLSLIHI